MLNRQSQPLDQAWQGLDFPSDTTLIAAVSGGSDSLALLVSLRDHLALNRPDVQLIAATIDHGLRTQSAIEAAAVSTVCTARGIQHITRRWQGDKPSTGIAEAARAARYRLLGEIASEFGASAILTGHTADDQAETIAMRRARGAGRGLAGMAPVSLLDGSCWLLRPLLGIRRTTLRQFLSYKQIGWIEDPTNEDNRYERPRIRRELASAGIGDLLALGTDAARERELLGIRAAAIIEEAASRPAPGLIWINASLSRHDDRNAALYAMRILLAVAGGRQHLPGEETTRALLDTLSRSTINWRGTLSRSVIDRRKDSIFLYRENRNLPQAILSGDRLVWDGRYRIECSLARQERMLVTLGSQQADPLPHPSIPPSVLRAAQSAEPGIQSQNGNALALDGTCPGIRARPVAAPWAALLPSFDFAPARAVANLIGAQIPLDSPYQRHSEGHDLTQS